MKKETLLEIILGTIGGLIFAIGMCMGLIPEWNMLKEGIIVGVIGFIILLCIIPIYRKNHPKTKVKKQTDWGIVATWIIGYKVHSFRYFPPKLLAAAVTACISA